MQRAPETMKGKEGKAKPARRMDLLRAALREISSSCGSKCVVSRLGHHHRCCRIPLTPTKNRFQETPGSHIANAKELIAILAYKTVNEEYWDIPFGVRQQQPLLTCCYDVQPSKLAVTRGHSCPLQHH